MKPLWSSAPYVTEIFKDLKLNNPEPDPTTVITIGAEDNPDVGAGGRCDGGGVPVMSSAGHGKECDACDEQN